MPEVSQEVMQRLVRKLGGAGAAAAYLGIPARLLTRFIEGTTAVPDALLLKAMDAVQAAEPPPMSAVQPESPGPKGPPVI